MELVLQNQADQNLDSQKAEKYMFSKEMDTLFSRIDKTIRKNSKSKVGDDDLNTIRAFLVSQQRPLQAVRLLQKEREERETDAKFTNQKEEIIESAKELDKMREEFKEQEKALIQKLIDQTPTLEANANKRSSEVTKLNQEIEQIKLKEEQKKKLEQQLANKQAELDTKEQDKLKHEQFHTFFTKLLEDPSIAGQFKDEDDLKNRFISLKNENKYLRQRKIKINQELEESRVKDKEELNNLKTKLYNKQVELQRIQKDLEKITAQNSQLEQDYENELNKKNSNSKEIGQIVNSVNNIFQMCVQQNQVRKPTYINKIPPTKETDPNIVDSMIVKLTQVHTTVNELCEVFNIYGKNYDKDKAYTDDIQQEALKQQKDKNKH